MAAHPSLLAIVPLLKTLSARRQKVSHCGRRVPRHKGDSAVGEFPDLRQLSSSGVNAALATLGASPVCSSAFPQGKAGVGQESRWAEER
ncbi:hypothetical protein [Dendronalium sp. ChiSLP03b]|uniref:hypothetical protein n=1 Tax=Dendronalium sp. ChiSLP03b TaxID=3075381 RepID=UPI003918CA41